MRSTRAASPSRRLHQHAELGDREPDRRRARAERYPAGRDAGGDGRGRVDGPVERPREANEAARQGDIKYRIDWTTLGEYLAYLEKKGISPNVASFVGATTVRVHELGEGDVDPTPEQLQRMRMLVRQAMDEGAMGVGSSLIYAPANFAETPELIALASEAGRCGGMYISHIRDEGPKLIEAIDELVEISEKSGAPAEIYHFKQSGRDNWRKIDAAIARVEAARARGLGSPPTCTPIRPARPGSTRRCRCGSRPAGSSNGSSGSRTRRSGRGRWPRCAKPDASENTKLAVQEPDKVILVGFKTEALKPLTGKTLGEVARERGKPPEEVVADLIVADGTRIQVVYFGMSEENVAREVTLPWMSFGSDAAAMAPEGVFLKSSTHPRAYGNFARLLGKYVREEKRAAAGRGSAAADLISRRPISASSRPRRAEARQLRRHRHIRSRQDRRPRDLH